MIIKILTCPKCGSDKIILNKGIASIFIKDDYSFECSECGFSKSELSITIEGAIKIWNGTPRKEVKIEVFDEA